MKSQVSFVFDGEHNKQGILNVLNQNLKGLKHKFEKEGRNVYRIYVAAKESEKKTFEVCYGIQCFCVKDYNREL